MPLVGWIGRLDHQKGPDLALEAVPGLAARGCQVRFCPTQPQSIDSILGVCRWKLFYIMQMKGCTPVEQGCMCR